MRHARKACEIEGEAGMTERERLLAVYRGETPDRVPFALDLSHWFAHRHRAPFDLSQSVTTPECDLLECHRRFGAGFYLPNRSAFFEVVEAPDVTSKVWKEPHGRSEEIVWRFETPLGAVERRRLWREESWSWNISRWGVESIEDLAVLAYALGRREYRPRFERWLEYNQAVGETGLVYFNIGYSAIGYLMSLWMGPENVVYAAADAPVEFGRAVDAINESALRLVDLACSSPAEVVFMSDNFSSDLQPPHFFRRWSAPYYREVFRRLDAAGKFSSVHVDGRMRGLLRELGRAGADCIDAATPFPGGDMSPKECRAEAGGDLILSGGVPPTVWIESASDADFDSSVLDWLALRAQSPRLIAAAGDQVPPDALEHRIERMGALIEEHGRYG